MRTRLLGLVGAFAVWGVILLAIRYSLVLLGMPTNNLSDFGSFIAAGRAATLGLNPYVVYPSITAGMGAAVDTAKSQS